MLSGKTYELRETFNFGWILVDCDTNEIILRGGDKDELINIFRNDQIGNRYCIREIDKDGKVINTFTSGSL